MNKDNVKKCLRKTASLNLFFWSMIWLMIITVAGTIEQKDLGLFAAQEKYFSSLYFTFKGIPLPGGGLIILILTIGLIGQLFFKTSYKSSKKRGIVLTHFGAIILLVGSLLTHLFAVEGSLIFKEGEQKNYIRDYKNYELSITNDQDSTLFSYDLSSIKEGSSLKEKVKVADDIYLAKITNIENCSLAQNQSPKDEEVGFARLFTFIKSAKKEESEHCVEAVFEHKQKTMIYRVFYQMAKEQSFEVASVKGILQVQNKRLTLPFQLKLIDFEKKFYQGTMISKSFKSHVEIQDGNLIFKRLIEMNSPLRYKGYTFYQSSFSENSSGEISELAVVKNTADWFPYISSFILCFGVLLHLIIKAREVVSKENQSGITK